MAHAIFLGVTFASVPACGKPSPGSNARVLLDFVSDSPECCTAIGVLISLIRAGFFFSSRRRHTRCLSDWSSTCALPISFQVSRLGAAIRHATAKLEKQEARTRLLIVLSDGRPYDHDYGDARYAREDTREALVNAKTRGITPFCITIDRESESELRDLYGEVGYTIIDDVLSLPERLPGIYRRLTT